MSSVDERPISDARLRARVLAPEESWMLQAPAGSGKTELLMQRYLAVLATVEEPESVLAITFTRKAASEMRNRILAALDRAASLDENEIAACPPHERQSLTLARRVLEISARRDWRLRQAPSRLQVRTLDSFCEAIANRAPCKGLLGGLASVAEDAQPLYEQAAQRLLAELSAPGAVGEAVAALLAHLDNDLVRARALLAALLARRDQWMEFLGRSDLFGSSEQQNLRERLEVALHSAVEEELTRIRRQVASALAPGQAEELRELRRYAAAQLDRPAPRECCDVAESNVATETSLSLAASADAAAENATHDSMLPPATTAFLADWQGIGEFLLTSTHELRKTVNKNDGFPTGGAREKQFKQRALDLLQALRALPGAEQLRVALDRLRVLPAPHYSDLQWELLRALLSLLPRAAAYLHLVFTEQATVDFAEYAQRALDALGSAEEPTDLGLQMGYRIRHVLVDEFQDTSRPQIELLRRLIATWQLDELNSTFCVGDPMQSIYAFRQADVAIFQQTSRNGIGENRHRFDQLQCNFRSQAALVDWFNRIFPPIFGAADELTNAVSYAPAAATRQELTGEAVCLRGFASGAKAEEATYVAACVRRELDELASPTEADAARPRIAILVRSRSHLPELVAALRAAGIRYRAVKTDSLAGRSVVRDLEALRQALSDRADRTAWLAVLRAPWCGLTLSDLLTLCCNDEQATVCELLAARGARLSSIAQAVLTRVQPIFADALAHYGRQSLRALVESTWLRLGGVSCLGGEYADATLRQAARDEALRDAAAYFALLEAESPTGLLRDPDGFAHKLDELYAPADPSRDIQVEIMPIHQAKGLEWDVVFLPALERRPRQEQKSLLYWRLRTVDEREQLLLGPMEALGQRKANSHAPATIEGYLRRLSGDCQQEELKRLFYVAATRARRRLYLSACVDAAHGPQRGSILHLLWTLPDLAACFVAPAQAEETLSKEKTMSLSLLRRLPADYAAPDAPTALVWNSDAPPSTGDEHRFEWVGELLPRVGVVAHSFLERIAREGVERWDAAKVEASRSTMTVLLRRAGVAQAEMEEGLTRLRQALLATLADERGRWLLAQHEEAECELALSAVIDGHLEHVRVDRTFVEDGVRWLVDYKITAREGGDLEHFVAMQVEKYRPDLARYVRALRLWDSRPLRCALYLPLLSRFCPVEI